jgi:hypothetical protein
MSASGTHVDVNDACATRLLSRVRVECGRVESNHHSHWRRGYNALSSPMLGVRGIGRPVGLEPTLRGSQPRMLAVTSRPPRRQRRGSWGEPWVPPTEEMEGGIGYPQPEAETLPGRMAPEPAVLPFSSPASVITTPPPPHRLALGAYRPSRTLGPALCAALFRHFLDPPVDGSILRKWRGWDSNPRSRAHEAREDSRSSTARRSLERERKIWSAGLEPAISDARSRWGGQAPLRPVDSTSSPAGLEPATRGVEALCSSAELRGDRRPWNRTTLHRRIRAAPAQSACRRRFISRREDSNLRPPPSQGGARIR